MGTSIADLSDSGHRSGDVTPSNIKYIAGLPFVVVGASIWWGGWALRRKHGALRHPRVICRAIMIAAVLFE